MAYDFPASPSEGQQFTPAGGPTFVYQSGVWNQQTGTAAQVVISDAAPSNPYNGQFWWESDSGNLFVWYDDGSSAQWVQVNFGMGVQGPKGDTGDRGPTGAQGDATAQPRNRIVNGAMQISQENGNTAGSTMGYYMADQWYVSGATTGVISALRVGVTTPKGSINRLRITVSTADTSIAAGEYLRFTQVLEGVRVDDFGWGFGSAAKQVIVRFGFKGPAGTYSFHWGNPAGTRSYVKNFTITAGQANTDTEQVIVVPGDTTGVWPFDTNAGAALGITLMAGTTYQAPAEGWNGGLYLGTAATINGMGTVGNTFELFDVGIYLDLNNTGVPPPWIEPDMAQELRTCQRYWQKHGPNVIMGEGYGAASSGGYWTYLLPVTMRVAPSNAFITPATSNCSGLNTWTILPGSVSFVVTVTAAGAWYAYFGFTLSARP